MSKVFMKLSGICKSFGGVQALKDIDMEIMEGETRCLAGENGGGKSTLIKIISGYYTPDSGSIEIGGKTYSKMTPQQAIDEGIQIIYQDFSIFPNLTVAENIAMPSERMDGKKFVDWKSIRAKAQKALDMVNVKMDLDALVGDLPVADKQLVAICRALLQDAKLLIMDEPTTALTKKEVDALFKVVRDLQAKGITIIFVSHKLEEVFEICEKLTILRSGEKVIEGDMADFDREKFIYYMTGRKIKESYYEKPNIAGDCLMKVDNIGIKTLFKSVSFELYPGEILGITGLLGSGRSELARALFGLEQLTEGKIYMDGKEVVLKSVTDAIDLGIGYVPEDRLTEGLFLPHTISRNIIAPVIKRNLTKSGMIDNKKIEGSVDDWIDELKIKTPSGKLPAQALSGGNQQKVVIAKWLEPQPRVLILNCPTVGVDIGSKTDIQAYARKLAQDGMGVIVISDDIPEVLQTCSRVLIMKKGRIVEEHPVTDLTEQSLAAKLSES
ncbi:MAG: sugar ABC transporter ATP-binding protein [Oscillospiraceae bacterium]|nr:sugar ABC transporter ATP-binding protein [Oscillospiraceae bacterium]